MIRQFLRRNLPTARSINDNWVIRRMGLKVNIPGIFTLSKRTVPSAVAVGIFIAFIPIPFQMLLVTLVAVFLRINLPLGLTMIFVTNPITMGPLYYLCYQLGVWITHPTSTAFGMDNASSLTQLTAITYPLWVGCLTAGATLSIIAYLTSQLIWRSSILAQKGTLAKRLAQR